MRVFVDRIVSHYALLVCPFFMTARILGDALYGSATTSPSPLVSARASIPEGRLFLHSSSISFWVRAFCFLSSLFPFLFFQPRRLIISTSRDIGAKGFANVFV